MNLTDFNYQTLVKFSEYYKKNWNRGRKNDPDSSELLYLGIMPFYDAGILLLRATNKGVYPIEEYNWNDIARALGLQNTREMVKEDIM